jgi:hypothetical protein
MSEKDPKPPPLNTNTDDERIRSFYRQRVSVALQRVQIAIILGQAVVTAGEASYRVPVLSGFFLSSPYLICFVLLVMGSGLRCHVCSS